MPLTSATMMKSKHRFQSIGRSLGAIALMVAMAGPALGAVESIPAAPTTLTSTSTRMISYRHQQHMWQTPDGATHLLINRGVQVPGGALQLQSTFDGGATWSSGPSLPQTNGLNVSDGQLSGNDLYVAYANANNQIMMGLLRYDPALKTWSLLRNQSVAVQSGVVYSNPAIGFDRAGNLYVTYVAQDSATLVYSLRMSVRAAGQLAWTELPQVFGSSDAESAQRSGRPVLTPDGIGMVFTVHDGMYWAQRQDGWSLDTPWSLSTIYMTPPPSDPDPYASHFSVVRDTAGNVHMATVDKGRVLYARYLAATQAWETPRQVASPMGAGWVQLTIAGDNLVLMANMLSMVRVYQSGNAGNSFIATHMLTHPLAPDGSGLDYGAPRMETPSVSTSPIPTVQQYIEGQTQKLMFFAVPVVPVQ